MGKAHHKGSKYTSLDTSVLGNPYAVTEVLLDSHREPFVVCDVDRRRKCDSYYVSVNRELEKDINKGIEFIKQDIYTCLATGDNITIYLDELIDILSKTINKSHKE